MNTAKKLISLCLAAVLTVGLGISALALSSEKSADAKPTVSGTPGEKSDVKKVHDKKGFAHVDVLGIAASVLGISKEEVKKSVKTGKVGDLLIAAGKVDAFKVAYLSAKKEKLDTAVTDGKLTRAEADEKYEAAEAKMAAYDGTTGLCGHGNHSKTGENKEKPSDPAKTQSAA